MSKKSLKYALAFGVAALFLLSAFGVLPAQNALGRVRQATRMQDTTRNITAQTGATAIPQNSSLRQGSMALTSRRQAASQNPRPDNQPPVHATGTDATDAERSTLPAGTSFSADSLSGNAGITADSVGSAPRPDSLSADGEHIPDSLRRDTLPVKNFLDYTISGKNKDSLEYYVRDKRVFIHRQGEVAYGEDMDLKADHIEVMIDTKELYAYGYTDTLGVKSRPSLDDGGHNYIMDTVAYNISSGKAKIKGVMTKEGDGILHGESIKKRKDNTSDIIRGKYTTCDEDHPHFYIHLTQAKLIPNDKIIVGPAWLVIEDVPFPLVIPEAFFPMTSRRSAGIIVPNFGDDNQRGFYLRDAGYYIPIGDHLDLTLRGSLYTLGSWEVRANSNYTNRYKYAGAFDFNYSKTIIGDKGQPGYQNSGSYKIGWQHRLDPKAKPGTTFSASVDFETSGYGEYGAETLNEYIKSSSSSTMSYARNWAGTPFSFNTTLRLDQNRQDSTWTFNFPTVNFSMSRINPFKRKNAAGKERWYEKIAVTYNANINNNVKVKEADAFKEQMFKDMKYGVTHKATASAPFNILGFITFNPSANYNENWYFQKMEKEWDYQQQKQVVRDTTYGFHRVYDYSFSGNMETTIYGMWTFRNKAFPIQIIRHVLKPSLGFSWTPDFNNDKYGFFLPVQRDSTGMVEYYSPYTGATRGSGRGGGSINFALSQSIEAKVLDDTDTTGMSKIKFIDDFSIRGNYNLSVSEFKLSNLNLSLRLTLPVEALNNFQINLNATLDPYLVVVENGERVRKNKLAWGAGKLGRIVNTGWSFSHTFNGGKEVTPGAINDNSYDPMYDPESPFFFDPGNPIDPMTRRQMMAKTYYDFSVPWSLTFGYNVTYTDDLRSGRKLSQQVNFSGNLNLTPKWGINISQFRFDFDSMQFTPGQFSLTRNLHCWQMSFNWSPFGRHRQWSFSINVLSSMLKDIKYDKSNSQYDNIYHQSAGRQ